MGGRGGWRGERTEEGSSGLGTGGEGGGEGWVWGFWCVLIWWIGFRMIPRLA